MTRLLEILISLAIVLALFLVVGVLLPSSRHIEEKVETNRKLTIVYDTVDSLRRFSDWNPLVLRDPKMQMQLSGPASGVGARLDYDSNKAQLGKGSWEIVANEPRASVTYAIDNPQHGHDKTTTFTLKPTGRAGRNVEITQSYDVNYGWNLIGRYAGLYVSRHVGDDMELGLQRLANMLAQVPNVDYAVQGSKLKGLKIVDVPAEDLLVVSAGSIERNNLKIQASMRSNMEWINRTMAENGLEAAGPMRIISTELGTENYTFDVVVPVRRTGEVSASGEAMTGLKLLGPVKYERPEAHRAVTASYTGYMAELQLVRNALRAWALTQGEESSGRPYEVYKNGIDQAFTADGQYDVYWSIK